MNIKIKKLFATFVAGLILAMMIPVQAQTETPEVGSRFRVWIQADLTRGEVIAVEGTFVTIALETEFVNRNGNIEGIGIGEISFDTGRSGLREAFAVGDNIDPGIFRARITGVVTEIDEEDGGFFFTATGRISSGCIGIGNSLVRLGNGNTNWLPGGCADAPSVGQTTLNFGSTSKGGGTNI